MTTPRNGGGRLRLGDLEADLQSEELRSGGRRVLLAEQPLAVLGALLEKPRAAACIEGRYG